MDTRKRVYISGPITGRDEQECREAFGRAWAELDAKGYRVFDPWDLHDDIGPCDYDKMLRVDMAVVETCDVIYMLRGWQESFGAQMEKSRAEWYGLEVWYEPPQE